MKIFKSLIAKFLSKILFFCVFFGSASLAEDKNKLDEVVVSASYPADINGYSYDLQNYKIPYYYSDGANYLQSMPAIVGGRFGGHGLEPFIRGQSQNQLNIVANDSFTFGGCPNRMDPPSAYLNINSYDKITVTKGYQSVLNGPGASGGTIILERTAPKLEKDYKINGEITAGYDSNSNSWNSANNIIAGNDKAYIKAHGSIKDANNYEDGNGNEVRSAFTERAGGMTVGLTPDDGHIYFSYDFHEIENALFAGSTMDSPLSRNNILRTGYEKQFDSGLIKTIDASAYASMVDHEMDNYSLRNRQAMLRRVDSKSNTYGAKLKTDFAVIDKIVKTSLEYRYNNRDADRLQGITVNNVDNLQSTMWPDIVANEIGLAAETTHNLSKIDRITAGVRYDYVNVGYGRADQKSSVTGFSADDLYEQFYGYKSSKQIEHNFGGLIRYEYDFDDKAKIYSALSRSVRTADATERGLANSMVMMGNNLSWVGNPNIKPEKHHQFDIGFVNNNEDSNFEANIYINHVNDYILRDSARGQSGVLINAVNADIYRNIDALLAGFELSASWNILSNLKFSGNAIYTYGENLTDNIALAQTPPMQGKIGFDWQAYQDIEFGTDMRWALKQTRVDTDPTIGTGRDLGKTSGYAIFDLNTKITKIKPVTFDLGISNLFDKKYANHLNRANAVDPTQYRVNEPGRSFYVKAHLPF